MSDQFDESLKQRLQHYEEEPRKDLWNHIAPHIINGNKPFINWKALIFIVVVLIPLVGGYVYNKKQVSLTTAFIPEKAINSLTSSILNLKEISSEPESLIEQRVTSSKSISEVIDSKNLNNEMSAGSNFKEVVSGTSRNEIKALPSQQELIQLETSLAIADIQKKEQHTDSVRAKQEISTVNGVAKKNKEDGVIIRKFKKNRKHSIYVIAMPTFGYQRIESNKNDNIIIESVKRIPAFSTKRLGIRAEIGIEYKMSPRLKVYGGLLYYQRKQTIDFIEKQVDSLKVTDENGDVSIEPVFKYVDKSIEYELKNVGIQTGFNYELSKRKLLHVLGSGIELHKPLNKADFNKISMGFGQNPDYYVFYNFYYRLQYPSEGKLKAVIQPSLNYSLYIHQNWNAPFYVKPYGLGLHIGCTYSF